MKLGGIEFGLVWNSAGARNFFGDSYRAHRLWGPFAPRWEGSTFVAKTTTVEPRGGNMPLRGTEPKELIPACIKINFYKAAVLNAVGLSGPGLESLLASGSWQSRVEPFVLSFMAVQADFMERLGKTREFAAAVARVRPKFRSSFGVEINISCPNVCVNYENIVSESRSILATLNHHLPRVPLIPKINALMPASIARDIATHPACSAICVSNTIPWGMAPEFIDWKGLFGEMSPLAHLGGGGLSGAPIWPLVYEWVARRNRDGHFPVPVIAGGGVVHAWQAIKLLDLGASAVELGSVAIVRPWRVAGIIKTVNEYKRAKA